MPSDQIAVVFAPTGPLQELSESSGWGKEFLALANRCDAALAAVRRATFACSICGEPAGTVALQGTQLRRESFTSTLTQPVMPETSARLRAALAAGDARGVFELDFEYAPFYCPTCGASYCGDHWTRWDVFDEENPDWHDSIRGRCPQGHERMLED